MRKVTIAYPLRPVGELADNFDARRRPVKGSDRRAGKYPYYGAQGIVDYVDSFLFDGTYVLVAEDGENLRSKKMPVALIASGRFWVNNHAHVLKGNEKIDTAFLHYAINAVDISGYITGSTIPKLSTGSLNRILIPSPPPPEQRVIASVLCSLDDKIDLNRRMNETLETMARAIFKDWFVRFGPTRAKIGGNGPYLSPEIWAMFPDRLDDDERPVGWPVKKWGEVASLEYGRRLEGYQTVDGKVPVFGTNGIIGRCQTPLCTTAGVIIGRKGAYRGVHLSNIPFYVIDTAFYLKPKLPCSLHWSYYSVLRLDINSMDSGSAIPSTSREDFYNLEVIYPRPELHAKFEETLKPLWDKQISNDHQTESLSTLRDLLLPKLMSGEIRVRDVEKQVEAVL